MNIDISPDKRVIRNESKNNNFSQEDRVKYLEDAIRNGGYYGTNGVWNSIIVFSGDKHVYRARVETLIIKDVLLLYCSSTL